MIGEFDPILHPHSIEMAKTRLDSSDPHIAVHAALTLQTGELPDPAHVEATVNRLTLRMHDAAKEGISPQTVLADAVKGMTPR